MHKIYISTDSSTILSCTYIFFLCD